MGPCPTAPNGRWSPPTSFRSIGASTSDGPCPSQAQKPALTSVTTVLFLRPRGRKLVVGTKSAFQLGMNLDFGPSPRHNRRSPALTKGGIVIRSLLALHSRAYDQRTRRRWMIVDLRKRNLRPFLCPLFHDRRLRRIHGSWGMIMGSDAEIL
ncbi:hypothetical protein THAOC_10695 [Thalassiosira oceanica]|uniref:Uncharacterized protein n=1 Tax=Thalassiosira oceanica TaxID=159749 RepID=K0TCG8_THAOC|nr:hypothetical protein THAOC_10695 [Thalassiosira oceanica]|eukprot:EJK68152.1 hypothetical protein THAOC_10695 [Thalassiosira oceanica]